RRPELEGLGDLLRRRAGGRGRRDRDRAVRGAGDLRLPGPRPARRAARIECRPARGRRRGVEATFAAMTSIRISLLALLPLLPLAAGEPAKLTFDDADARLRRAYALARETND